MSDFLLSIIVPVYNSESTLLRCAKSLLLQKTREIQLIFINDASTDSSLEILQQIETLAPERILVVDLNENHGPGSARNIGLEYSEGKYIGFVDSDDYVAGGMYDKLIRAAQVGNYDMVDCGFVDEANDRAILLTGREQRGELDSQQRSELIAEGGYLVTRIYNRELILDNQIRFRDDTYMLEDIEIMTELLARTKKLGAVEETLYYYTKSEGSLSKTWNYRRYVDSVANAMEALSNLKNKLENYYELEDAIEFEMLHIYDIGIYAALADRRNDHTLDTLKELDRLRKIRSECVRPGYDNPYVKQRISPESISRMRANDGDSEQLMNRFM
ncbi:MAG: glycosyltransferase [Lachnospiraceae bacterium]|nr:glycosyltransferase [Lachnospiraceae bacterium]